MSRDVDAEGGARAAGCQGACRPLAKGVAQFAALGAVLWGLGACSPVFDWRESRPADGLTLLFPCKPDQVTRQVPIAGAPQAMTLWSCSAGDLTFALSQVDAADPARVEALLTALRTALAGNVGGSTPAELRAEDAAVAGATPHPLAQRLLLRGRRADGSAIEAQGQFFRQGLRVFQATVVGSRLDPQALEMFFSSLKITS